jgi:hypothetical protein
MKSNSIYLLLILLLIVYVISGCGEKKTICNCVCRKQHPQD